MPSPYHREDPADEEALNLGGKALVAVGRAAAAIGRALQPKSPHDTSAPGAAKAIRERRKRMEKEE